MSPEGDYECDKCGGVIEPGDYWIHVATSHHRDPENPEKWDRDNPKNSALTLCPECFERIDL